MTTKEERVTLYELLGRHWSTGAPVTDAVFDPPGEAVAFALADGALATVPLSDPEPPADRTRVALDDGGRRTISPRVKPVRPLTKAIVSDDAPLLAAFGTSGFTVTNRDKLLQVSASGVAHVVANHVSSIDLLAPLSNGGVVVASGGTITFYGSNSNVDWRLQHAGGPTAIAVSRDRQRFAMGIDGVVLVQAFGLQSDCEPASSYELGPVSNLSWSPDGAWLAASVAKATIALVRLKDSKVFRIPNYPAEVTSLSWQNDSRMLLTSGGYRIVTWDVCSLDDRSERPMSAATGHSRLVLVGAVDAHPSRPLVAAGYDDGRIVVAKIGEAEELVVKPSGHGAVQALRWSRDGQHLAVGTRDGEAAIVTFPPHIFK